MDGLICTNTCKSGYFRQLLSGGMKVKVCIDTCNDNMIILSIE